MILLLLFSPDCPFCRGLHGRRGVLGLAAKRAGVDFYEKDITKPTDDDERDWVKVRFPTVPVIATLSRNGESHKFDGKRTVEAISAWLEERKRTA